MEYRCALVTGASRGIGAAIASALVAEGLTVHALGRDERALGDLAARLGDRLRPIAADVRDHESIGRKLEGAEIDVLVNNAGGLSSVRPLQEQTAQEIDDNIALNLTAPLQMIRTVLPGMIALGRGHIFNLTSTVASGVFPGTTSYGAAKAGLSQAGRIIRHELVGTNVRLTEIAPGRVETQFYLQAFGGDSAGLKERMYSHQRPLRPEDIAAVLLCALRLPSHADVAELILSPTDQAIGGSVYSTIPASAR